MSDYFTQLKDITTPNNSTTLGFYTKILYSIYVSSGIKQSEMDATSLATQYKNDSEILRNPDKLNEFLANQNKNAFDLFGVINIMPALLTIKQEYLEYHNQYGIPPDFIYNFDKLNQIKTQLNI